MKENRDDHDAQKRKDDSTTGNNWGEDLKKKKTWKSKERLKRNLNIRLRIEGSEKKKKKIFGG